MNCIGKKGIQYHKGAIQWWGIKYDSKELIWIQMHCNIFKSMTRIRIGFDRVVSISIDVEMYWKYIDCINKDKSRLKYIEKNELNAIRLTLNNNILKLIEGDWF